MTDQRHSLRQSAALERIATAMERIAAALESLDEPQTYEVATNHVGRVTHIREVKAP